MKNILTNFVIAQGPINNNQYTHFAHKKRSVLGRTSLIFFGEFSDRFLFIPRLQDNFDDLLII